MPTKKIGLREFRMLQGFSWGYLHERVEIVYTALGFRSYKG